MNIPPPNPQDWTILNGYPLSLPKKDSLPIEVGEKNKTINLPIFLYDLSSIGSGELYELTICHLNAADLCALQQVNYICSENTYLQVAIDAAKLAKPTIQTLRRTLCTLFYSSKHVLGILTDPIHFLNQGYTSKLLITVRNAILKENALESSPKDFIENNVILNEINLKPSDEEIVTPVWIHAKEILRKWYAVLDCAVQFDANGGHELHLTNDQVRSQIGYLLKSNFCKKLSNYLIETKLDLCHLSASNLINDPNLTKALDLFEDDRIIFESHLERIQAKETHDINEFWHEVHLLEEEMPIIEKLDLSEYSLHFLPENLDELSDLTSLNLFYNNLIELHESIGNLQNLTELNLDSNKLTTLPKSIGNLQNLTTLNIAGQRLILPKEILELKNLELLLDQFTLDDLKEKSYWKLENSEVTPVLLVGSRSGLSQINPITQRRQWVVNPSMILHINEKIIQAWIASETPNNYLEIFENISNTQIPKNFIHSFNQWVGHLVKNDLVSSLTEDKRLRVFDFLDFLPPIQNNPHPLRGHRQFLRYGGPMPSLGPPIPQVPLPTGDPSLAILYAGPLVTEVVDEEPESEDSM